MDDRTTDRDAQPNWLMPWGWRWTDWLCLCGIGLLLYPISFVVMIALHSRGFLTDRAMEAMSVFYVPIGILIMLWTR